MREVMAESAEESTSIYSGILRLRDLSLSLPAHGTHLYLVVPDAREAEVILQLRRPSLQDRQTDVRYILFSVLRKNCDALCRFGESRCILSKISKQIA